MMTTTKKFYTPSKSLLLLISLALFIILTLSLSPLSGNEVDMHQWTINLVNKVQFQESEQLSVINITLLFSCLALGTSVGLPRQIAALVAGINLGAVIGTIVATLAATLGCWLTFTLSRYLLSRKISAKYPNKIDSLSAFIGRKTFIKTIVIRLLPIGSNFLTNMIAGVSKVSMKAFVGGSLVGFIPQMVIFSLAGSGIRLGAKNELIASAALFLIALLLTAYLVKTRKQKTNLTDKH